MDFFRDHLSSACRLVIAKSMRVKKAPKPAMRSDANNKAPAKGPPNFGPKTCGSQSSRSWSPEIGRDSAPTEPKPKGDTRQSEAIELTISASRTQPKTRSGRPAFDQNGASFSSRIRGRWEA